MLVTRYYARPSPILMVCQGDIYRDVRTAFVNELTEHDGVMPDVETVTYAYAVVVSQACDLEQDYRDRLAGGEFQSSYVPSVLLLPAYLAEELRGGKHLSGLGLTTKPISSQPWKIVAQNNNKRYHFLAGDPKLNVPDLVVDFKHYFTVPRQYMYEEAVNAAKGKYVATLSDLFREELSQRFGYYLTRIGLPEVGPDS